MTAAAASWSKPEISSYNTQNSLSNIDTLILFEKRNKETPGQGTVMYETSLKLLK
jgi:hypothetical protein